MEQRERRYYCSRVFLVLACIPISYELISCHDLSAPLGSYRSSMPWCISHEIFFFFWFGPCCMNVTWLLLPGFLSPLNTFFLSACLPCPVWQASLAFAQLPRTRRQTEASKSFLWITFFILNIGTGFIRKGRKETASACYLGAFFPISLQKSFPHQIVRTICVPCLNANPSKLYLLQRTELYERDKSLRPYSNRREGVTEYDRPCSLGQGLCMTLTISLGYLRADSSMWVQESGEAAWMAG